MSGSPTYILLVAICFVAVVSGKDERLKLVDKSLLRGLQSGDVGLCFGGEDPYRATRNASCQTYPASGECGIYFGGKQVYLYNELSFEAQEAIVRQQIIDARLIRSEDACYQLAIKTACRRTYFECTEIGEEAVPILPCRSECEEYWNTCESQQLLYYGFVLNQDPSLARTVACGVTISNGIITWNNDGIYDTFGGRDIPGQYLTPLGYDGQEIFPDGFATYNLSNGTLINLTCSAYTTLPFEEAEINCTFPLALAEDENECIFECPYFAFSREQYELMYWLHVVPMIPGLLCCIYVFIDSSLVIFNGRLQNTIASAVKYFNDWLNGASQGPQTGDSGKRRQAREVRAATVYAYFGSLASLVYFCIGPILVAFGSYGADLGCPTDSDGFKVTEFNDPVDESQACKANRSSVFLLQIVLNVIVFAICRVRLVVAGSMALRSRDGTKEKALKIILTIYCFCTPFLCWVIALALDDPGYFTNRIFISLTRWALTCGPRLTIAQELLLIFVPLLFSSFIILLVSLDIFRTTFAIQGRTGKRQRSNSHAKKLEPQTQDTVDKSLQLFQRRLVILGALAAVLIIVYTVSTALTLPRFEALADKIAEFITCTTVTSACGGTCTFPDDEEGRPRAYLIALQLACLSCIPALFGIFFMLTALDRRSREKEMSHGTSKEIDEGSKGLESKGNSLGSSKAKSAVAVTMVEHESARILPPLPKESYPAPPKVDEML